MLNLERSSLVRLVGRWAEQRRVRRSILPAGAATADRVSQGRKSPEPGASLPRKEVAGQDGQSEAALVLAQDALQLNEWRLQALLRFTEMTRASLSEIALFAMEEAVRLTRSRIGYLAFTSEDESVLTMYAWSRTAMDQCAIQNKPIVYPVDATGLWGEAVRQRKPIIVNDYAAPNPLKKGYPPGHVPVSRHMNIPVFDGDRIVAVAGVGNKEQEYDESDVRQLRLLMDGMWRLIRRQQTERELAAYQQHLQQLVDDRTAELSRANHQLEREIADRKQVQSRLVQTEKLASLGMLSAGVAHEINNPLAYVANNLAVLEQATQGLAHLLDSIDQVRPEVEALRPGVFGRFDQMAEEIDLPYIRGSLARIMASTRQGVKRVADIVQNLSNFARLDRATVDRVDLRESIASSLEMIRGRLDRRRITVTIQADDLPRVVCQPAQVNQVLLNLMVNAMQAIELSKKDEGHIDVSLHVRDHEVVLEVADDGGGIAPDVLPQIFDPFFTTKPVGQGTGLGLSISHSIIAEHGGRIEVESQLGQGSRFLVYLPIEGKGPDHEQRTQALPAGGG